MNDAPELLPAATRLGRSALTVGNETDVVAFYRDVVGLTVLTRTAEITVLGAGETPCLELHHDADARPRPADAAGLFHNAFRVPSREALGDTLTRIRDRWQLDGASDHGVSEALYCSDPEGNGVEIYRDRPRDEWPRDDDDGVQIGSWPLDLEAVAAAATGASEETMPAGTDLGHIHLETSSLEAARAFYVDDLGFDVKTATPEALFLAAGDYHHHLGVNTWSGRSAPAPTDARGLSWFELVVPSSEALDALRTRLEGGGRTIREIDDGLEVADPDGIRLRVRTET